jgi:CcmD family protein
MVNNYLFAAYTLVWIIFMTYAWNISRRQAKLRKDLEELKRSRQSTAKS